MTLREAAAADRTKMAKAAAISAAADEVINSYLPRFTTVVIMCTCFPALSVEGVLYLFVGDCHARNGTGGGVFSVFAPNDNTTGSGGSGGRSNSSNHNSSSSSSSSVICGFYFDNNALNEPDPNMAVWWYLQGAFIIVLGCFMATYFIVQRARFRNSFGRFGSDPTVTFYEAMYLWAAFYGCNHIGKGLW